jgi:hypothetical protein
MKPPVVPTADVRVSAVLVPRLRELALRGLTRMYRGRDRGFAFRVRRARDGVRLEGSSLRYTAISLIGLAGESEPAQAAVLAGVDARTACAPLVRAACSVDNLGDVALALWAAAAAGVRDRRALAERLLALRPEAAPHATVEVAWTLAALCADVDAGGAGMRERLARRLIAAWEPRSGMFPHRLGSPGAAGLRGHVCCFADLVYPIHALARYAELSGEVHARDVAAQSARAVCERQGPAGQWWWHYDRRTGRVVERYPVYAVHQDSMAPMALLAVEGATGLDLGRPIARGLAWLACAPELEGRSLVDEGADLIWRKVARREPRKLSRTVQAAVSGVHWRLRVPGLDALFPAIAIDHEDRPYHLGWILHAWPAARAAAWPARAVA